MVESLTTIAQGYFRGRLLAVAARLGIADQLEHGPRTVEQLAEATETIPDPLYRLLRALAGFGIVSEIEPRTFALSAMGQPLRKDHPASEWNGVVFWGDLLLDSWVYLTECMRTGKSGFGQSAREGSWSQDPDARRIFGAYFGGLPPDNFTAIAAAFDFSGRRVVADLGGAGGGLISAVLNRNPELRGILIDRELWIEEARANVASQPRCEVIAADLAESVPGGADVHMLKNVLHGYADDQAVRILQNCADSLEPGGCVLVIEFLLPDLVDDPSPDLEQRLMSDINMLAVTGGRERNAREWRDLLDTAGFVCKQIYPVSGSPFSIIEAQPR